MPSIKELTPKNILLLHGSSDLYGASKILLITAKTLKESNFNVTVVLSEDGPLANSLQQESINVSICKLGILRRKYFSFTGLLNRVYYLFKARLILNKIIKEYNIDLIYSNTTGVLIGALVAKENNIKHVWHVHEIIQKPLLFTRFLGYILNTCSDKIIVVSNEVKKHWINYIKEDKIFTIHNGLDYSDYTSSTPKLKEELNLTNEHLLIGMVGRVNLWKGQSYFLNIASILSKRYSNLRFVLAGDAYPGYEYLYDEINSYIQDNGLGNLVHNLGFRKDIPSILSSLDIFVLPSIDPDPLPTVVLEAMACGKPVIATAHGGALEMVDNEATGFLIPWKDAESASQLFISIIDSTSKRLEMGKNGRNRVLNKFSLDQYRNQVLTLINSLL